VVRGTTTGASDEEAREFLQRRLRKFGLIAGNFFLVAWLIRLVGGLAEGYGVRLISVSMGGHLAASLALLAAWVVARGKPRSMGTLRFVEAATILEASLAMVIMALDIPIIGHPHKIVLVAVSFGLFVRVIYIPSSPKRTFWLMSAVSVMAVVGTYVTVMLNATPEVMAALAVMVEASDIGPIAVTASEMAVGWAFEVALYWGFAVGLCTAGSQVIYGLRREVRHSKRLGQYTLESLLGEGGMGAVYRASHAMLRRPTAIKLLLPDKAGEDALVRFEREVQLTARLTHANTITVFDYGRTPDGLFYYAMELLDGATVADVVELTGPQPPERVRHILSACAGALAEAHDIGLIHRDVKPGNIMLCTQGGEADVPKVLDFGLVKQLGANVSNSLSASTTIVGTPLYLSPEAVTSANLLDHRADIYALGAVGYYLLTGRHVFEGGNIIEVCMKHVGEAPIPPSDRLGEPVHPALEALVLRCLAKLPGERPQNARELREALLEISDLPRWNGAWWWDEHGATIADVHTERQASSLNETIDIDMLARRQPAPGKT